MVVTSMFDHPVGHRANVLVSISGSDDRFVFGSEFPKEGALAFAHEGVSYDEKDEKNSLYEYDVCLSGAQHNGHWVLSLSPKFPPPRSPPFPSEQVLEDCRAQFCLFGTAAGSSVAGAWAGVLSFGDSPLRQVPFR